MAEQPVPVTWQALYYRLKRIIAKRRKWDDWTRVKSTQVLQDPPLLFKPESQRNLTDPINEDFAVELASELTRPAVGGCEKVDDLALLIRTNLKENLKG